MMNLLVTYTDAGGMPRAYALGPEEKRHEIEEEASQHLDAYIAARKRYGEAVSRDDFVRKEEHCPRIVDTKQHL